MKTIIITLLISGLLGCKNSLTPESKNYDNFHLQLKGTWKATSLFLSDASTNVCHEKKSDRDITFTFSGDMNDDKTSYKVNGSGPINNYFGSISFISFDNETKTGKIAFKNIGATEMAGSTEMMTCEQNFFNFLGETTGFQIFDENPTKLHLGRIRDNLAPTRDGGTYYVFEKIK